MLSFGTRGYVLIAMIVVCGGCSRESHVVVPHKESAMEQYYFAARYERQMIPSKDKERRESQLRREIQVYEKVEDYFPEDRTHTPLARLSIADLWGELRQNEKSAKQYAKIRADYQENEYVVVKSLWAEGKVRDAMGQAEQGQELYRECLDRFSDSQDDVIRVIVSDARRRYQRVR